MVPRLSLSQAGDVTSTCVRFMMKGVGNAAGNDET